MDFHRIKKIIGPQHTSAPDEWKGAVLFLCNEDHVFLIKRAETMPTHSGQVAFIGGHRLSQETDPWTVAQREFEEETQHSRDHVELLGFLPPVMTARSIPVIPVMAKLLLPTGQFLREIKSNGEWDDVIAYPWEELMVEKNWEFAWRHSQVDTPVLFHAIRPGTYLPLEKNVNHHLLWGATAHMIWTFLHLYFKS